LGGAGVTAKCSATFAYFMRLIVENKREGAAVRQTVIGREKSARLVG
jgi:hypothetical protein